MACFERLQDGDPYTIALAVAGGLLFLLSLVALVHARGPAARGRSLGWSAVLVVGAVVLGLAVFLLDLQNAELVRSAVAQSTIAQPLEIVLTGYKLSAQTIMLGWLALLAPLCVGLFLFVRGAMLPVAAGAPDARPAGGRTALLATVLIAVGLFLGAWALTDYLRFGDVLIALTMAI